MTPQTPVHPIIYLHTRVNSAFRDSNYPCLNYPCLNSLVYVLGISPFLIFSLLLWLQHFRQGLSQLLDPSIDRGGGRDGTDLDRRGSPVHKPIRRKLGLTRSRNGFGRRLARALLRPEFLLFRGKEFPCRGLLALACATSSLTK